MSEASVTPSERARKAHVNVLQAMQDPGTAKTVAVAMGTSEATISRIKNDKLEDSISLLYQLGFKVVPNEMQCYPEDYVQALYALAKRHMEAPKQTLTWD